MESAWTGRQAAHDRAALCEETDDVRSQDRRRAGQGGSNEDATAFKVTSSPLLQIIQSRCEQGKYHDLGYM